MSEIRHQDRILEAIDQLRKRKARPDVNRICSFMFRRFAVNCIETKLDLQKLIDAEIVIKVDYKGNTSYRNAAKWAMLPSYKYKKEIDTSSLISSAVAELIVLEPDYLDIGVPDFELEEHMIQKDNKRFSKKNLEAILKREVEIGTLVKLENGNYFLGEHSSMNSSSTMDRPSASHVGSTARPKSNLASRQTSRQKKIKLLSRHNVNESSNDSDKMKPDDQSNTSESANVGFRVGGRQKRARIVFDPSDNNLPTRVNKKRGPGRPLGSLNKTSSSNNNSNSSSSTPTVSSPPSVKTTIVSSPTPSPSPKSSVNTGTQVKPPFCKTYDLSSPPNNPSLCYLCNSYGNRVKGVPERVISCSECTRRAHPSCLEATRDNDGPNRKGTWQCVDCRVCTVCDSPSGSRGLLKCIACHDCYHCECHDPPQPERCKAQITGWRCKNCPHPRVFTKQDIKELLDKCKDKVGLPTKPRIEHPIVLQRKEPIAPEQVKKETTIAPPLTLPEAKPRDIPANCLQDPFEDIPIDETIPDAKHWSTNQVFQYFSTHFKPELAQVFKDQDIDGQSLLLMKRMDVLTNLSLKLGPALKVYGHVRKLQTRKSHPKILWS